MDFLIGFILSSNSVNDNGRAYNDAAINVFAALTDGLFAQPELIDQAAIPVRVTRLQIIEQFATSRYHPQQTAARVMILGVGLEVFGKAVDARSQQGDLHLGRSSV